MDTDSPGQSSGPWRDPDGTCEAFTTHDRFARLLVWTLESFQEMPRGSLTSSLQKEKNK